MFLFSLFMSAELLLAKDSFSQTCVDRVTQELTAQNFFIEQTVALPWYKPYNEYHDQFAGYRVDVRAKGCSHFWGNVAFLCERSLDGAITISQTGDLNSVCGHP